MGGNGVNVLVEVGCGGKWFGRWNFWGEGGGAMVGNGDMWGKCLDGGYFGGQWGAKGGGGFGDKDEKVDDGAQ